MLCGSVTVCGQGPPTAWGLSAIWPLGNLRSVLAHCTCKYFAQSLGRILHQIVCLPSLSTRAVCATSAVPVEKSEWCTIRVGSANAFRSHMDARQILNNGAMDVWTITCTTQGGVRGLARTLMSLIESLPSCMQELIMLRGGCTRNASCITIQLSVNVKVGMHTPTRRVISSSACSKSLTCSVSFEQGSHLLWGQADQELGTFSVTAAFQLCLDLLLPLLPYSAASHTQNLQRNLSSEITLRRVETSNHEL